MIFDNDYEPKLILAAEQYDDYLLMLHRDLARMAENLDPPNPFRGLVNEGEGLAIRINDTNDLPYSISYMENNLIKEQGYKHIILADPRPIGYSNDLLDSIMKDTEYPSYWFKTQEWIIVMINFLENEKLVIKNGEFIIND